MRGKFLTVARVVVGGRAHLRRGQEFGLVALALAVVPGAAASLALFTPAAAAKPPSCAVSNERTHKGYDALQNAVDAAKAGDTLEVKGTCVGSTSVGRDITLSGIVNKAFPGTPTLDGNQSGRVLRITAGKTTIRDMVIANGRTAGDGGAILIDSGGSAALFDTAVRDSTAGSDNFGGGIEAIGNLLLTRSEVTGNSAGSSGGIDDNGATVSLNSSTVSDNHATHAPSLTGDGCGFGDPLTIYACAGGIWNFGGTLTLIDSTVTHNTAGYRGGGLRTDGRVNAVGALVNGGTILGGSTTIDTNSADNQGGGIWTRVRAPAPGNALVDPSVAFLVSDGSGSLTDPLTGAPVPAWTGSVTGNTPDQCFGLGFPTFSLGTHTCGATFN